MPRSCMLNIMIPTLLLGVLVATPSLAYRRHGRFRHRARPAPHARINDGGSITLPRGARRVNDVAYGSDSGQVFDVYIPRDARNAPILFMVHGGGWQRGDKRAVKVVQHKIDYFLPKGYLFVSINYRMVPRVGVMTEVNDVAHALSYVQHHATHWGGDASKLVVMGHSAARTWSRCLRPCRKSGETPTSKRGAARSLSTARPTMSSRS